jgi:hypothetical protein
MIRLAVLPLALAAFVSAAAPPSSTAKKGFRVYSVSGKCGSRRLIGVYATLAEAAKAAGVRRDSSQLNEVTAGTEGVKPPGRGDEAVLLTLHWRYPRQAIWSKGLVFGNSVQAQAAAGSCRAKGAETLIVRDYAPKEVYQVYGRTMALLLGRHPTIRQAFEDADAQRKGGYCGVHVVSGTSGKKPEGAFKYHVYIQGCKGGWSLELVTADEKKALNSAAAFVKEDRRAEVVRHYGRD